MYTRENIVAIVNDFISSLIKDGLEIDTAVLFGSYAEDRANEYSDIDLALVSPDFEGTRFHDMEKIRKQTVRFVDLEVHPFKTEDFCVENPFARHLIKNGHRIYPL